MCQESHLPHLPFTRPRTSSNRLLNQNAEDNRTTETIQLASLISNHYKSLSEIEIETAEAVAKMINASKIFLDLLVYLTSPKLGVKGAVGAVLSTQTPRPEAKGLHPTKRPLETLKRSKPNSAANEVQEPGSVLKSDPVVPKPENSCAGVEATNCCAPEDISAEEKGLPDEPPTAEKLSKTKNRGRKQIVNDRTKHKDAFTVTAYPTQRPARQKRTKRAVVTRQIPQNKKLRPEFCDLEVSVTQSPPHEPSDHDCHEEIAPNPQSISEDLPPKTCSSPEPSSKKYEELKASMAEEALEPEPVAAETESLPSDIIQNEDPVTLAYKQSALSLPIPERLMQQYGSGARGLLWAYRVNEEVDRSLGNAGIWLWRKPKTHFRPQPLLRTEMFEHPTLAPVIVSHKRTRNKEPIIEFDGVTVHIVPHKQCWKDVRSLESHPDFLVPRKLAEYQACEAAGYQIWRHDRDFQQCRKPGCEVMVSDYHHDAIVCLGCGPKSVVRYCSLLHQLEDIGDHWRECGTREVSLQRVIDHTTAPTKFAHMFPAIKRKYGSETAVLHRQMLYCTLTNGHYTLFYRHRRSTRSETLYWPRQDPKWQEMDQRIERLLNIAFFDGWNHCVLGYLYRLLRELLRSRSVWNEKMEWSLKLQFESEFSDYIVNTGWHNGDDPCHCEWWGRTLARWYGLSSCWKCLPAADASVSDDGLPGRRGEGVEATVRRYEASFWILRAWREQHPTQNNWRLRAAGYDFPDTRVDEGCYKLGPGWTGWGGEKDNIFEDQGEHQEDTRSTRSA